MKIHNLVSSQLKKKKQLTLMSSNLSPQYGHVVLVSGYLDLTAFN